MKVFKYLYVLCSILSIVSFYGKITENYPPFFYFEKPGFLFGIISGLLSPICSFLLFTTGFLNSVFQDFFNTGVGEFVRNIVIVYTAYGDPSYYFGFGYNFGFFVGLLFGVSVAVQLIKEQFTS